MTLSPDLPDANICKTRRTVIDWECLAHHSLYYFNCAYAVDIGGVWFCMHPEKNAFAERSSILTDAGNL
jgi:hypothetical protein